MDQSCQESQYKAESSYQNESQIFPIFSSKQFNSVEDQVIETFESCQIPEKFESFSITMNIIFRQTADKPIKKEENMNIFQTGTTHKKNLTIAMTPKNEIKVTFRQQKDQEFIYSQTKIKSGVPYDLSIVYEVVTDEDDQIFYNFNLYLNGKNETNLSLNYPIIKPSHNIYFGSESVLGTFTGQISDVYFITRALNHQENINLHAEKKNNPMDPKNPQAIIEETQYPHQDLGQTRRSIPPSLQKTHVTVMQNAIQGQSQMTVLDNKSIRSMNKQEFEQAELEAVFSRNIRLSQQCRELSLNFRWLITTLQQLSPPIEELNKPVLPFNCIHNFIASGKIEIHNVSLPLYIIEVDRFLKPLKYADIKINEDDIIQLAKITQSYYEFSWKDGGFEDFKDNFKKEYGCIHTDCKEPIDRFDFKAIVYDKFLIAIRDTILTPQEIAYIKKEYIKEMQDGEIKQIIEKDEDPNKKSQQQQVEEQLELNKKIEQQQKLHQQKQKTLSQLPLVQNASGTTFNYNSYSVFLGILEQNEINLQEAWNYVFKGIFLQRDYMGQSNTEEILEYHQYFYQSIANKGNIFNSLEQIFKNICKNEQLELDFENFFSYWRNQINPSHKKDKIQQVFKDMIFTKEDTITQKDFHYYFQGYIPVFVYQKKGTDQTIIFSLLDNQHSKPIITSQLVEQDAKQLKSISYTYKVLNEQKYINLFSIKQGYLNNFNQESEMKLFDEYNPELNAQYNILDLNKNQSECAGLEIQIKMYQKETKFNLLLDYNIFSIRPLHQEDAQKIHQNFKQVNEQIEETLKQQQQQKDNAAQQQGEDQLQQDEAQEKEQLPVPEPGWNNGKFILNLNRCTKCESHTTTTWHDEYDFAEKFNQFGEQFKGLFPNCEIIGNYDRPSMHYENFDIYIRGVGPAQDRDAEGRIWLYSKSEGIFSFIYAFNTRMIKVYDKLVLIAAAYGDTIEMEKTQEYYITRFESMISPRWKNSHGYPCDVPRRRIEIQREIEKEAEIKEGTKMICKNWGCGLEYEYTSDILAMKHACIFHPGSYQLGSIHGLWPESWTCCRKNWEEKGCIRGPHKGVTEKKLMFLCLNVGEINSMTKRPDSACGMYFNDEVPSECLIHPGFFKRSKLTSDEGEWTCCQDGNPSAKGCNASNPHKKAQWPDVEAKKYFVEKLISNPGIDNRNLIDKYDKSALRACIYRETIPYTPFVNQEKKKMQDRRLNENEIRICTRHGCFKIIKGEKQYLNEFADIDNIKLQEKRKKNCRFHPGLFDFGSTGAAKVSQASTDTLWKPHWQCCRQPWESEGCTKGYHDGPLRSDYVDNLKEKSKEVINYWKSIEENQKQLKNNEEKINDKCGKNEQEKNDLLAKLKQRYDQDLHNKSIEIQQFYQNLLESSKKNPRIIIDFYSKEFWPNPRAMKNFKKTVSTLWKGKLEGNKANEKDVKGVILDDNQIINIWNNLYKTDCVSLGRISQICDKLKLHLLTVSDRLDYHFKFWDVVNMDLRWFTQSDEFTREQFLEWWDMNIDEYLERKEAYKEEEIRKQKMRN